MQRFPFRESLPGSTRWLHRGLLVATCVVAMCNSPVRAGFEPFDVKGWIEPERALQSACLFVHYYPTVGSGCTFHAFTFPLVATVPAGVRTNYQFTISSGPAEGFDPALWRSSYTVIGVYDDEEGAVSLGYDPSFAAGLVAAGNEWEHFTSELTVALWLQSGMTASVQGFLIDISAPCAPDILANLGQRSPLVAYSHAVPNGSTFFEVECGGANGDTNCDGLVNFFDIDPFLLALFDSGAYVTANCGGRLCAADADDSGEVNFFDIDPFLACLFAGPGCP